MAALLLSYDDLADLAWWLGDSGVDLPGPLRRILGRIIDAKEDLPTGKTMGQAVAAAQQAASSYQGPTINNPTMRSQKIHVSDTLVREIQDFYFAHYGIAIGTTTARVLGSRRPACECGAAVNASPWDNKWEHLRDCLWRRS